MIKIEQKVKLLSGVISLIPEREKLRKLREIIKNKYLDYLENIYITDKDREFKEYWICSNHVEIKNKDFYLNSGFYYLDPDLVSEISKIYLISLSKNVPILSSYLVDIKQLDTKFWEYIKDEIQEYIKFSKNFIQRLNDFYKIIDDSSLTISLIKLNFPELYERYRNL